MDLHELRSTALDAARAAGNMLLERFGGPAEGVATKSTPTDLVSDADRDAERLILGIIAEARPHDGVLSEEGGGKGSTSGLRWVVDPLDGTVNFLFGLPMWGVSIAVEDPDGALVGVVFDPNRNETFVAARGEGAELNGRTIRVSEARDISRALIGTGFSYDEDVRAFQAGVVARLLPQVRDIRRAGSAALDLAWTACGRLDAFYESDMNAWDRAAGELLILEAGGVVTPLLPPARPDAEPEEAEHQGVIAANAVLHDRLSALVVG